MTASLHPFGMADGVLESEVRRQIKALLQGGQAHATFDEAVAVFAMEKQGLVPVGLPYSPWQLLEHLRLAQEDIVAFSDNANGTYRPKQWPKDYWPEAAAPPDAHAWERSVEAIRRDREAFEKLLEGGDLQQPFPWGDGQNLLRQALLIADHESYHLGELIVTRRLLGVWQPKPGHA